MKYIKYKVCTGLENMNTDEELLENAIATKEQEVIFRLYGWKPKCISLGRNQKLNFDTKGVDCVRRLTGGRALLHDDEVTYSCIVPVASIVEGENIMSSYKHISGILIDFFNTLGVELEYGENKKISTHFDYCMLLSTGADVCYKGEKIIGSAQCRKNGYILQHGSILFGYDKDLLESLFQEEVKGITTVKQIIPDISKEDFIKNFEKFITGERYAVSKI